MNCRCGYKITQQLCVPNIYFLERYKETYFKKPVISYEFKCPKCGTSTILSLKQFEGLKEEKENETY